ncbi:plasmodium falciparum CPW-WPC domain-containing protein, putative [Eimeria praecox]|uniref:Plasmodium falciparum CPW-WPC domain-containing protein, putative n=1 Tax=Eimeria praecox TaxID=51316 RepID=U6H1N1_9EIME|nr:plasmodium falciparum CPW-WPC domain-containing protein, putative [Eimeria praecox]
MKEKKRTQELPLKGYDLSVLQQELTQQIEAEDQQQQQQQQQQQPEQQQQQQQQQVVDLLIEQKFCPHDFSVLCPFAWTPTGDDTSCTAPEAYIGGCERQMNFAVSPSEKERIEDECLISWPCMKKCNRDFSLLCPENWKEV